MVLFVYIFTCRLFQAKNYNSSGTAYSPLLKNHPWMIIIFHSFFPPRTCLFKAVLLLIFKHFSTPNNYSNPDKTMMILSYGPLSRSKNLSFPSEFLGYIHNTEHYQYIINNIWTFILWLEGNTDRNRVHSLNPTWFKVLFEGLSSAPRVLRRSPIQVQTQLDVA